MPKPMKEIRHFVGRRYAPLLLLLCGSVSVAAQTEDRRIAAVRQLYKQVTEQIAQSEKETEGSELFCAELIVNKHGKSWPAVGRYQILYRFYFTYGDRERNPYPNRLVMASVVTRRSDRETREEFLFNRAGQLVFYFAQDEQDADAARRFYFSSGRVIRAMVGQRVVGPSEPEFVNRARTLVREQKRLLSLFRQAF
jgi:hypothetical protein